VAPPVFGEKSNAKINQEKSPAIRKSTARRKILEAASGAGQGGRRGKKKNEEQDKNRG